MGGGGPGYYGLSSHIEMESLVKAGLTPAEVITAATRNSAQIFGVENLGTIAPGKSADFLVLDANPLENIANTRRINRVYLRGQPVDRDALRAKWHPAPRAAAGYRPVTDWARLPDGMKWAQVAAAAADADGNLFVFDRISASSSSIRALSGLHVARRDCPLQSLLPTPYSLLPTPYATARSGRRVYRVDGAAVTAFGGSVADSPLNRNFCARFPGLTSAVYRLPFESTAM
jgi:hypothetical protein